MVNTCITVLEHDDLFVSATLINKPFLEVFRFKNNEFISTNELIWVLGFNYTPHCSQLTYKTDIWITKQLNLENRQINVIKGKTIKTAPSIITEPYACMQ